MKRFANRLAAAVTTAAILASPLAAFADEPQEAAPPPEPPPVVRFAQAPAPAPSPPPPAAPPTFVFYGGGPRVISDYQEGDRVPAGYHKEERVRSGLVAAGAGVFGGMYMLTALLGGWSTPSLLIPVAGPFILAGKTNDTSAQAATFLVIDGLVQAGGLAMLIAGVASPRTVLVRDKGATLGVAPMVGQATGATVVGTF